MPGERSKACYEEAISSLSRNINLPGFRKGKVPRTVVMQQLGAVRIKATALESLVDTVWREAIKQEALEPLSQPDLSGGFEGLLATFEPGSELTITLEADVAPTPKLKTTRGLTAEFEPVAYEASKIDDMLEDSRKQLATVVPVEDRSAAKGDSAVLGRQGTYSAGGRAIPAAHALRWRRSILIFRLRCGEGSDANAADKLWPTISCNSANSNCRTPRHQGSPLGHRPEPRHHL